MTTIKPGSRPSSKFDYDPSVLCEDNPNPPQCEQWPQQSYIHYRRILDHWNVLPTFMNQHRVSCLDFYNQSDNRLLWWQQLQQETNFHPKNVELYFNVYLDNNQACTNNTLFHFYINNRSNETTKKYDVEWQRGAPLRKKNDKNPHAINVCYTDNQTPRPFSIQRVVVYSFEECLLYYGKLANLVVNYPAAPN